MTEPLWVFGYGSLIWRPSIPYDEVHWARLAHFVRRFYQGSTDHRGVPEAPGRVVTLLPDPQGEVFGRVFRVPEAHRDEVLRRLDHRESGGYARIVTDVEILDSDLPERDRSAGAVRALLYIATPDNPNYLGPADPAEIARQVATAHGPSGPNDEYVRRLAQSLAEVGLSDGHLDAVTRALDRWARGHGA